MEGKDHAHRAITIRVIRERPGRRRTSPLPGIDRDWNQAHHWMRTDSARVTFLPFSRFPRMLAQSPVRTGATGISPSKTSKPEFRPRWNQRSLHLRCRRRAGHCSIRGKTQQPIAVKRGTRPAPLFHAGRESTPRQINHTPNSTCLTLWESKIAASIQSRISKPTADLSGAKG